MKSRFNVSLSGGDDGKLDVEVGVDGGGVPLNFINVRDDMKNRPGVFLTLGEGVAGLALSLDVNDARPALYNARISVGHFVPGRYELRGESHVAGESGSPAIAPSEPAVFYVAEKNDKPVAIPIEDRFRVQANGVLRLKKDMGSSHLWTDYDFSAVIRPDKNDPVQYPDAQLYPHGRFSEKVAPLPGRSSRTLARYEGGELFKVLSVVYEARKVEKDGAAYQCLRVVDEKGREGYLWSVYANLKYVEDASPEEFAVQAETPTPAAVVESRVLPVVLGESLRLKDGLGSSRLWKGYNFEKTRRMDAAVDFELYPNGRWDDGFAPLPARASDYGVVKSYAAGAFFQVLHVAYEAVSAGTNRKSYQCLYVRSADEEVEGYLWSVYDGVEYVESAVPPAVHQAAIIESPVLTLEPGRAYRLKTGMGTSGLWSDYDFNRVARSEADGEDAYPSADFYPNGRWSEADGTAPLPRPARSRSVITRYQGGETFRVLHVAYEAARAGGGESSYQCVMIEDDEERRGYLWSVYDGDVYIEETAETEAVAPAKMPGADEILVEARARIFSADELARVRSEMEPDEKTWEAVRAAQKALYRRALLVHHGYGELENAAAKTMPFVWNDDDWRNLWQLEAVVEFYMNFTDPRREGALVEGENKPRLPGHPDYIALDLSRDPTTSNRKAKKPFRGCHMIVVDSLGGRVAGRAATPAASRDSLSVETSELLARTNEGWDTVYIHPKSEAEAGAASRVFNIVSRSGAELKLDRPIPAEFGEGPFQWNIPAGLGSMNSPPFDYTLRETTNGFDHYDGVLFIVKDGVVHFRERVSSFTSRTHASHAANGRDMSLRGNNMYYFQSDPAGGNRTINYAFTLTAKSGYASTRMEARSYFASPVKKGVTWNLFVHYGYYIANRTGSAGCFTSPAFARIRDKVIELYQREYAAEYGSENTDAAKLYGLSQTESKTVFSRDLANEDTWWWSMKAWGNLWVVRPEERPEG